MDARLDPACTAARALDAKHREQAALLVGGGGESQLGSVVLHTQERQILAHLGTCAPCSRYRDPRCAGCGFDTRTSRHGWRCARSDPTWREWLPWNWRAKHAPAPARPEPARARAQTPRAKPTRFDETPTARPSKPASAANPIARSRSHPPAAKPSPTPLAQAYATLGITSAATPDEVRKTFRERAQQYHPDKVAQLGPEVREVAERKMKEINEAYERIKRSW